MHFDQFALSGQNNLAFMHLYCKTSISLYSYLKKINIIGPNKTICLVPVTCPPKIGRVGKDFFLFYSIILFVLLMLSEG